MTIENTVSEHAPTRTIEAFKALSNPVRFQILSWLRDPRDNFPTSPDDADFDRAGVRVSQIREKSGLAQSTISLYMTTLEQAELVVSTRIGKCTHYRRNEARIAALVEELGTSL